LLSSFVPFVSFLAPRDLRRVGCGGAISHPRGSPLPKEGHSVPSPYTASLAHCDDYACWVGFGGFPDMSQSTETLGNVLATVLLRFVGLGSICCDQSAVAMRLAARLASIKLTLLPRTSTASRTTDSEYLFWAEFFFHGVDIAYTECPKPMHRKGQSWTVLAIIYRELCTL
jgi:hypothetical protein